MTTKQALHDIVMNTPDLLPLSGAPRLTVIGREVALPTSGYADVIAVEPDGTPAISFLDASGKVVNQLGPTPQK